MPKPIRKRDSSLSKRENSTESISPGFINVVDIEDDDLNSKNYLICNDKNIKIINNNQQMDVEYYYPVKMVWIFL